MKYKLLKDTPTIKAGTIFEEIVSMSDGTRELAMAVPGEDIPEDPQFAIQDIDNFDEWFEEMEEPTDSAHWKPKIGERYFYIDTYGYMESEIWSDDFDDNRLMSLGVAYRTEEECKEALDRKLAEARLRLTSTFKPDLEKCKGGWVINYDYCAGILSYTHIYSTSRGEPVYYATREEAEKSIKENRADWRKYFGIKEEN